MKYYYFFNLLYDWDLIVNSVLRPRFSAMSRGL